MTDDERRRWEGRYREDDVRSPGDPSPVLRAVVDFLPAGRALDVATGRGRNARFLAAEGWSVDAVDISTAALADARDRPGGDAVDWILADADAYCFPEGAYAVVAVSYFDARDRLDDLLAALAPGGVLFYEHHLRRDGEAGGPSDRYRFDSNELLAACADLRIVYYVERARRDDGPVVTLVGQNAADDGGDREYPLLY